MKMAKKVDDILMCIMLLVIPLLETIFAELNWIFFESYRLSKIFTIIELTLGGIFVMSWTINVILYTIKEIREKRLKKEGLIKRYDTTRIQFIKGDITMNIFEKARQDHSIATNGFPDIEYLNDLDKVEKALDIILTKLVNMATLVNCDSVEQYNLAIKYDLTARELSWEEFELLTEIYND